MHVLISIFVALFLGVGQPAVPDEPASAVAPGTATAPPARAIRCPQPPSFRTSRAAVVRAENCADAATVQTLLLARGALAANVQVSQDGGRHVVAQVFFRAGAGHDWDAAAAALAISRAVDVDLRDVVIADSRLDALYDGPS